MTVNLVSYFWGGGSWDIVAQSLALAISRYQPVSLSAWLPPHSEAMVSEFLPLWQTCQAPDPHAPVIVIDARQEVNPAELIGTPKIVYFFWETSHIHAEYCDRLRRYDQIWVPSLWQYQVAVASGLPIDRLRIVPGGVDPACFFPANSRDRQGDRPYRFLSVGKWERRKGMEDLVAAFLQTFTAHEAVELVLHGHNPFNRQLDPAVALAEAAAPWGGTRGQIHLSAPTDRPGLAKLMRSCDAFVLPTRGEGWGLPILEAMACGLPCVVTNWSGLRSFAHPGNAYLIRVESFDPVDDQRFFQGDHRWGYWARPDGEHLRDLLRLVWEQPQAGRELGAIAQAEAVNWWSWDRAAQRALAAAFG